MEPATLDPFLGNVSNYSPCPQKGRLVKRGGGGLGGGGGGGGALGVRGGGGGGGGVACLMDSRAVGSGRQLSNQR